jgi:hypothetical protein
MSRFLRENWLLLAVSLAVAVMAVAWLLVRADGTGGVYPIY